MAVGYDTFHATRDHSLGGGGGGRGKEGSPQQHQGIRYMYVTYTHTHTRTTNHSRQAESSDNNHKSGKSCFYKDLADIIKVLPSWDTDLPASKL